MFARSESGRLLVLAIAAGSWVACVGSIGTEGDPAGPGGGSAGAGTSSGAGGGTAGDAGGGAGADSLERLRTDEVLASITAVLGLARPPTVTLPTDSYNASGFPAPGNVTENDISTLFGAADQLTSAFVPADYTRLSGGCDPSAGSEDACADALITTLATRAYRRPLLDDERADLRAVYDARKAAGDVYVDRMRLVVDTILDAPGFLYHTEALTDTPVSEGGLVKRGPYEMASRLAYFITRSPPDATLWQAAKSGSLDTPDAIATQAKRLLATPAARQMVSTFTSEWLGIDAILTVPKDGTEFPTFTADMRAAMHEETLDFTNYVVFDGDHSWTTLMTASFSFLNADLASHYGVSGVTGTQLQKVDLDATKRFGLLTQGSVLATLAGPSEENPVRRGKLIEEQFLCHDVSPPPMAFLPPADPPGQMLTIRQKFLQLHQQAGCNGCHNILDPPGFAFGHYNAIGWYEDTEKGLPIDTTGAALLASGGSLPFTDAKSLVQAIVASDDGQSCFARQWLRFALQRRETDADAAAMADILSSFKGASFDIQQLIVAVATSTPFRYRAQ